MTAKKKKVALHKRFFAHFARIVEAEVGRPHTFGIAFFIVVAWAVSGPLFGWSDTWQLVINTGTTIITFLMVFIIQYAQNRDTDAIKLKLDELILATKEADNKMIDLEELSEEELESLRQSLLKVARSRKSDD